MVYQCSTSGCELVKPTSTTKTVLSISCAEDTTAISYTVRTGLTLNTRYTHSLKESLFALQTATYDPNSTLHTCLL